MILGFQLKLLNINLWLQMLREYCLSLSSVIGFFFFNFIFKLYNIVLVLPNIEMNPPQVYMCYWGFYYHHYYNRHELFQGYYITLSLLQGGIPTTN